MERDPADWDSTRPAVRRTYWFLGQYIPDDIKARGFRQNRDLRLRELSYFRPNDLCSGIATPIPGLYLCSASVYPGGMILAGGGYLAANVLADALEVKKWWTEPAAITRAREKNFIR